MRKQAGALSNILQRACTTVNSKDLKYCQIYILKIKQHIVKISKKYYY